MRNGFIVVSSVIVVTLIVVVVASTTFFARPLRLYDYGTPLLAGVVTLIMMRLDRARQ